MVLILRSLALRNNMSLFIKVYHLQLGLFLKPLLCVLCHEWTFAKQSLVVLLSSGASTCCVSGVAEAWTVTASAICCCPRCPLSGRQVSPTDTLLLVSLLPHSQLDESRNRSTPFCNVHFIGLRNKGLSSISQSLSSSWDYSAEA